MVCSRCKQHGHIRSNHLCPLFEQEQHFLRQQQELQTRIVLVREQEHLRKYNEINVYLLTLIGIILRWISFDYYCHNTTEYLHHNELKNIYLLCLNTRNIIINQRDPTNENINSTIRLHEYVYFKFIELTNFARRIYIEEYSNYIIDNNQSTIFTSNIPLRSINIHSTKRNLEICVSTVLSDENFNCELCFEENNPKNMLCLFDKLHNKQNNCIHKICVNCVCHLITSRNTNLEIPILCPWCRGVIKKINTNCNETKTIILNTL